MWVPGAGCLENFLMTSNSRNELECKIRIFLNIKKMCLRVFEFVLYYNSTSPVKM
jgi:hypothetical protein